MAAPYIGNKFGEPDHEKLADFEKRVDPNNAEQMSLLEEMRMHTKKVCIGISRELYTTHE